MNIQNDIDQKFRKARLDCFLFLPCISAAVWVMFNIPNATVRWMCALMLLCYAGMLLVAWKLSRLSRRWAALQADLADSRPARIAYVRQEIIDAFQRANGKTLDTDYPSSSCDVDREAARKFHHLIR